MKACAALGVEGVTLYPGTKHSTVTALGQVLSPEQIKRGGTGHATNAAFERYMLPDMREKLKVRSAVKKLRQPGQQPVNVYDLTKISKLPKLCYKNLLRVYQKCIGVFGERFQDRGF